MCSNEDPAQPERKKEILKKKKKRQKTEKPVDGNVKMTIPDISGFAIEGMGQKAKEYWWSGVAKSWTRLSD